MAIDFQSNQTANGTSNADVLLGNDPSGINTNDIVYGLQGNDIIEPVGFPQAINDSTLYGGQGEDLIYAQSNNVICGNKGNDTVVVYGVTNFNDQFIPASNNTIYGGQGDDTVDLDSGSKNVVYAGAGNSTIEADFQTGDTIYGGVGNANASVGVGGIHSSIFLFETATSVVYGVGGDDTLSSAEIFSYGTSGNPVYGGQGNDLISPEFDNGSLFYAGAGNDLIESEFTNSDVLYGQQGNDDIQEDNSNNRV